MKAVSLLVNSYLPDDLKDYSQVYDSKSINRILYAVALKHPDLYAKLEKQIGDIGRNASYINGETITLGDLEPVIDRKALYDSMDSEIKALPRDRNFTGRRREIFQKYNNIIEKETAKAGLAKRNNIAMSVLSGARGKNPQFKAMVSTPGTYSDYKGETVDVFSKESFADGIRPAMFCASTNGTRASVVSAKVSTAKGGDWAKQMAAISANQVIREQDCKTGNGISLPIDDTSIVGRKLAKDAGKFKAGEFVTREMLASMANDGVKNVVVRSALTCGTKNGLCAHCIGKYFNGGKLPKIGDSVGLVASTSSSEPVTQMALSAKHTAGMTKDKMTFSGLPVIQQFTQSPEKFKDRATLSEVDGKVDSVEEAPQGGMYVTVAGRRHYVLPGHDVEVKAGDTVEAGDELSEGLADAEDIVRLKGLGAGRKYYADRLSRILEDSGAASDRRNIEIIARGAVNHVRITGNDSVGAYLPDDVVDYNALQATYAAPETSIRTAPSQAVGKYIQEPVLHYSIGTRVTPNVAKDLKDNGYDSVLVDQSVPGFEPELVRLRTASHNNRDWLASQATSYLTQQIEDSVVRGDDTNVLANDDYRPRIAYGRGFAENAGETGRF